jgi:hypothetical protein
VYKIMNIDDGEIKMELCEALTKCPRKNGGKVARCDIENYHSKSIR